jgi:glucosylglycerate synthase
MTSTGSSVTPPAAEPLTAGADLVIGVPAYNMARTIEGALAPVRASVLGPLHALRTVVVLADGGSTDGTVERAADLLRDVPRGLSRSYALHAADQLSLPFHGLPGRARALRALFEVSQASRAKGCVVVDAGAAGLTAEGVAGLARAVHDEAFDYAVGVYHRPVFAGALTRSIVAPVFRACYGARLQQPMGGEFACSGRFVAHCLDPDSAIDSADPVAVNLRVAIAAVTGGFRCGEVLAGTRRGGSREDGLDLGTTVAQVVGALFGELEQTATVWHRVRRSVALPIIGPRPGGIPADPPAVEPLLEAFRLGYRELREIWSEILPPSSILALKRLASAPEAEFQVESSTWARLVYDFALAYRLRAVARDQLLRSLTPLYLGWLASFVQQVRGVSDGEAAERLEQVCLAFEAEKPHLISGWRWPERFRPVRMR